MPAVLLYTESVDPYHLYSKQDVARITAMARLPHQVGKRTLRIEYVDDVGLGPIVTCPTDQGKMSVGDSSSRFSSSPTAKVEIDVEDEDVSAGERDASAEAGPGCTRDALDDGASVPIRCEWPNCHQFFAFEGAELSNVLRNSLAQRLLESPPRPLLPTKARARKSKRSTKSCSLSQTGWCVS